MRSIIAIFLFAPILLFSQNDWNSLQVSETPFDIAAFPMDDAWGTPASDIPGLVFVDRNEESAIYYFGEMNIVFGPFLCSGFYMIYKKGYGLMQVWTRVDDRLKNHILGASIRFHGPVEKSGTDEEGKWYTWYEGNTIMSICEKYSSEVWIYFMPVIEQ